MIQAEALSSLHRTFRDPAGSVELRANGVYRSVHASRAAEVIDFLDSHLASKLMDAGQLIAAEVRGYDDNGLQLYHPLISFISYPWEWPSSLWMNAAELTLDICSQLLTGGWILKDATPLNILFEGVTPKLVDLLSIERMDQSRPLWLAYGQFVRTFLLPMLAHSQLGWPLQATQIRRDGFEPEEVYDALSRLGRLKRPALGTVTLPILLARMMGARLSSKSKEPQPSALAQKISDPQIVMQIIRKRLNDLRAAMQRAVPARRASLWSEYVSNSGHYTERDHGEKRSFVAAVLKECAPQHVLDVGCNTGTYSRLAALTGAEVIAIDTDMHALDRFCAEIQHREMKILPLCVDLAYPTAAHGWENRETLSFLSRAEGHFDMVMMLAVIHHLLLSSQIPMEHIASLCSRLTTRNLILEWVPPTDPKYLEILRGRDAIYEHITECSMRESFAAHFHIRQEVLLANGRTLFHMVKR